MSPCVERGAVGGDGEARAGARDRLFVARRSLDRAQVLTPAWNSAPRATPAMMKAMTTSSSAKPRSCRHGEGVPLPWRRCRSCLVLVSIMSEWVPFRSTRVRLAGRADRGAQRAMVIGCAERPTKIRRASLPSVPSRFLGPAIRALGGPDRRVEGEGLLTACLRRVAAWSSLPDLPGRRQTDRS